MPKVETLKNNYIEKSLSKILRGLMAEERITQAVIAEQLGVTQQNVSIKIATGRMSAKDLIIILRTCNASDETIERLKKL